MPNELETLAATCSSSLTPSSSVQWRCVLKVRLVVACLLLVLVYADPLHAEDCDAQCQAARKAQDPLAPITALLTDNAIGFGPTEDNTNYNFQLQPVHTFEGADANVIVRGIVPIVGAPNGVSDTNWGFGDSIVQVFYKPNLNSDPGAFSVGFGPQVSFPTQTNMVGGPEWGAGPVLVGFGSAGDLNYGGVVGHLWGQDDFSLSTINLILLYNTKIFGGSYFGYNNNIFYDWNARSNSRLTLPLGLTAGKAFILDDGAVIDAQIGAYGLADRPSGGSDWQLKFALSFILP